jgi:hypothetical protein
MPRLIVEAVSAPGAAKDGSSSGIDVGVSVSDEAGNPVNGLSAAKFVLASIYAPGPASGLELNGVFEVSSATGWPVDGFYKLSVSPVGANVWHQGGYLCVLVVSQARGTGGWPPTFIWDRGQTVFRIDVTK